MSNTSNLHFYLFDNSDSSWYLLYMDKIITYLDGKKVEAEYLGLYKSLASYDGKSYSDNPTVGLLVNGKLKSLSERIEAKGDIESVKLFSNLGKRIYRKTLTLLLSYASSLVYPRRPLSIGHSLGDGYYFRYEDSPSFSISDLKDAMNNIVKKKTEIANVVLSHEDAIRYAEENAQSETRELLESINQSGYEFTKCGSYLQLYTEPVLPDFSIVTLWDLMEYEGGLLLRYPQSRSIEKILPFTDNKLLFSVFEESRRNEEAININSLGDLNMSIANGSIKDVIRLMEAQQRRKIIKIADMINDKKSARLIFIAGPSSSGKTTFSLKLADELKILGKKAIKISLDDYYKPRAEVPKDESGDYDYEVLEALKTDLFEENVKDLLSGKGVHLPSFSFIKQETIFSKQEFKMDDNTYLIIEGIHGLNPHLLPDLDPSLSFKIYISALTLLNLDSSTRISTTDNRILRRIVRDNRTRGFDAIETLNRWPSVERGEKNHIFPYQNNADVMINSALDYELAILAPKAIPLLRRVKKEDKDAYPSAQRLLSFLSFISPADSTLVPSDSILREFIGSSVYGAV